MLSSYITCSEPNIELWQILCSVSKIKHHCKIHYHKERLRYCGEATQHENKTYIYLATRLMTVDKLLSHLYMHLWVRIHVVKELLVVDVLLIPLKRLVIAEVVSQRDKKHLAAVEFGLLTVLIQEQVCPDWQRGRVSYKKCCISFGTPTVLLCKCQFSRKSLWPWRGEDPISPGVFFHQPLKCTLESSYGPLKAA